jgi:GT2 family glycosyltransferase
MKLNTPILSIIIVNYNTKDLLKNTVNSVLEGKKGIHIEIIVVDNNSSDDSVLMIEQEYPMVKVIQNDKNLGFPKANNIGIKQSTGRYVLLLNSDTEVIGDCLEKCINYLDNHMDVGVLGPKLLLANGELDHACKRGFPTPEASFWYILKMYKLFPGNKHFGRYNMSYLPYDEINEVDSLTGAFMMLKREVIEQVGLLDEQFFMYGEDLDWCLRIKEAGWRVIYYPETATIHYKGGSSRKKRYKTIYEFHRAMYLFYNKHYIKKYVFFITWMVYIGIVIKLVLEMLLNLLKTVQGLNLIKGKAVGKRYGIYDKGKSKISK